MRVLFLSNFDPPADRGGREQSCQELADAVRQRGHQEVVVTNRYGLDQVRVAEPDSQRMLYRESGLEDYAPCELFSKLSPLVRSLLQMVRHMPSWPMFPRGCSVVDKTHDATLRRDAMTKAACDGLAA